MDGPEVDEVEVVSIYPDPIHYGVIASGFLYRLVFSIRNNLTVPVRVKVTVTKENKEENSIRLMAPFEQLAPGLSKKGVLELTAEFPGSSIFKLEISQSSSSRKFFRQIEATVVSQSTFKHVKKSLQLQKRPIYRENVTMVGPLPAAELLSVTSHSATSFSDVRILDEDEFEDLLDIPMTSCTYWDPFAKCLRLDPALGHVVVDSSLSIEEVKERTESIRAERRDELEEQGFLTLTSLNTMRETQNSGGPDTHSEELEEDEEREVGTLADMSYSRILSVTSLLAMKRERLEKQRKHSIQSAQLFRADSIKDSMVNSIRTLRMIREKERTKKVLTQKELV